MKERLGSVPLKPGVYLYKDKEDKVIYVGKAKALRNRMRSYFQSNDKLHPKVRAMMNRVADFDFIVTNSEVEALILENNLIKAYKPRYNIELRDDKTYPYLKVTTGDEFPRVCITREKKDGVSRYFGPYTDVNSLRETLKILTGVFPLRTCRTLKKQPRACLNRDIEKCLAPCAGLVSAEEYRETVEALINFMEGNSRELLHSLQEQMQEASSRLEFEKAARIRDKINSIKKIGEKQKINFENPYDIDVIGMFSGEKRSLVLVFKIRSGRIIAKDTFWLNRAINEEEAELLEFFLKHYYDENFDIPAEVLMSQLPAELELVEEWLRTKTGYKVTLRVPQRGSKKDMLDMVLDNATLLWEEKQQQEAGNTKALVHLSQVLNLEVVPERIECYDISHLAGEETVASMVVFTGGMPDKKAYRRFKIKTDQNNDYASMSEVIGRRFKEARQGNAAFLPEPDLIIIDGGLGQVNIAKRVLDELRVDIPVFGLAEKHEEIFTPSVGEPLRLSRRDDGLKLLQRLRDEAHRFAIEYNRKRRERKIRSSALDSIAGVGEKRKKALLAHFGSVARIRQAAVDEISLVPGMNRKVAQNIYNYFRERNN
ncbi:MAG: excinuclease ABC subunit UvrC [Syntrophomonadaceae bacterium]|nr:excinuclease ABC subunit UvrC [Syntrophomonadaceae bacterium]MDD4549789.1 excinuclease ABC subunit UvrC [Syntrophomonadaceae bacterium]